MANEVAPNSGVALLTHPDVAKGELQKQIEEEWRLHWINYMIEQDKLKYNSHDESLTFELALKHKNHVNWKEFSYNPNVKMSYILAYPDLPWSWSGLSANSSITLSDIESNLDKQWDWGIMYRNNNVTCDFIEKYIDQHWWWRSMHCVHLHITSDFVEKHIDKPWDFNEICRFIKISFHVIEKHMDKNWNFASLSSRSDLPLSLVETYPDKGWHIRSIFCHPDLTFDFVQNSNFFQYVSKDTNFQWQTEIGVYYGISFKHYESRWIDKRTLSTLLVYLYDFYNNPSTYDNHNTTISITNVERILHDEFIAKTILCYV
jgi:hypothetical protein